MPKFIAHALMGASIVAAIHPPVNLKRWGPLILGAVLAVSPDFDLIFEWILKIPDVHRGYSHSLIFSLIIGLLISGFTGKEQGKIAIAYSLAYLSHALLDFLTSTTGGVKLFYPFSNNYYNLGLTNIFELPFGSNLTETFKWVSIETLFFLPILLIIIIIKKLVHKNP